MKKVLREPLVHFLVLGLALFLLARWRGSSAGTAGGHILVPAGRIEALAGGFTRTWGRPPTRAELEGLVDEWVREEVLYREALARGLDRDDTIVRRRLRQKLEFLAGDLAERVEPDEQPQAWLEQHADLYRRPPRLALRQVYVSPDRRGASARRDALALLESLRALGADADLTELGDPILLPSELELQPLEAIERSFGPGFGQDLLGLEPGAWHGPIESSYGLHLVLVTAREEGRLPALEEVRAAVERDLLAARQVELVEAFYQGLRARYEVEVQWPRPGPDAAQESR